MAVARASSAESIRTGVEDPYTFLFTPAGVPRGILVAIVSGTGTSITTAIDYGGVNLANVISASDTVTETGRASFWFVGSGIPTGQQTVTHNLISAVTDDIHYVVWELSGDSDLAVIDSDLLQENQADPVVTLQKVGRTAICICAMYGGGSAPQGTLQTGNTLDHTHDLGAFYSQTCFETTVDSSDHAIGWSTLTSDDLAFIAVAISETTVALVGLLFASTPSFPLGTVALPPVPLPDSLLGEPRRRRIKNILVDDAAV